MNKKAASILMMVFELTVVIMVSFLVLNFAERAGSSETTVKRNIANDVKMMLDTFAGISGNAVVQYPSDASKHTISVTSTKIIVSGKDDDKKEIEKFYSLPEGMSASGTVSGAQRICMEKKNQDIFLRECSQHEVAA